MSNFKNPFHQKSVPVPRLRGVALARPDGTWGWDLDIFVGDEYVASLGHPEDAPGYISKDAAIVEMRKQAMESGNMIVREVYGVIPEGYIDLTTNEFNANL